MTFAQQVGVTVLAAMPAILAVIYTQRRADRRSAQERLHVKMLQADDWRRQRCTQAHVAFYAEAHRAFYLAAWRSRGDMDPDQSIGSEWNLDLWQLLAAVETFGSVEAASCARRVAAAINDVGNTGASVGSMMHADLVVEEYRRSIQVDLGIAITRLPENWSSRELDGLNDSVSG